MHHKLKIILFSIFLCLSFTIKAQDDDYYEFGIGLTGYAWQNHLDFELDWHIALNRNVTVNAGLRAQRVYEDEIYGYDEDWFYEIEDSGEYTNFLIPISIKAKGTLISGEKRKLSLFLQPGVAIHPFIIRRENVIQTPRHGYGDSKSLKCKQSFKPCYAYILCQGGLEFNTGKDYSIALGCEVNNQDVQKKLRGHRINGVSLNKNLSDLQNVYFNAFLRLVLFI